MKKKKPKKTKRPQSAKGKKGTVFVRGVGYVYPGGTGL